MQFKTVDLFLMGWLWKNTKRNIYAKIWSCKVASHAKIGGTNILGSCIWRKPLKGQGLLSVFEGLDYLLNTQNFILLLCKYLFLSLSQYLLGSNSILSVLPKYASVVPIGNGICSKGNSDCPLGLTDIRARGSHSWTPLGFKIPLSITLILNIGMETLLFIQVFFLGNSNEMKHGRRKNLLSFLGL